MAAVDVTQVLVALIATVPAVVSAVLVYLVRREVQTPSGDTIGQVAERTHDLTAADLMTTQKVHAMVTTSERRDEQRDADDLAEGTGPN